VIRLLVLVALAACGSQPACPVFPRPTGPTQPFLWKVQKGDAVVWLYGTIHNAGEGEVPQAAWTALESSPRVVSELGDTEPDPEKTAKHVWLPTGKGLDQQLPASDWYDLRDALRGVIKEADLARARPWYAMARLNATFARPPSPTMDFAITKRARGKGKPVDALESAEVQLAALADTVTLADLQQALHERKTIKCTLDHLKAIYASGDLPAMTARLVIPQTHKLVVDRSKAWLPKIEGYFASGGAFVAVGLGHLAGDEGIPKLLERAGYTVARVP
jgi:uncharacterized protein YbaP (TraB family)